MLRKIYNGKDVEYVLYKLYDKSILADEFGIDCYEKKGKAMIVCGEDVVVPFNDRSGDVECLSLQVMNALARDIRMD